MANTFKAIRLNNPVATVNYVLYVTIVGDGSGEIINKQMNLVSGDLGLAPKIFAIRSDLSGFSAMLLTKATTNQIWYQLPSDMNIDQCFRKFGGIPGYYLPISSATVTTAGNMTAIPTVTVNSDGHGSGGTVSVATMKAVSEVIQAAGGSTSHSYVTADTITLTGGTASTQPIITVDSTTLVSLAINAGGSGYVIGDTITLTGGTQTTPVVLTVATLSGSAIATFTITNGGQFTVNSATFTQNTTSGVGTGATFQTGLFGVGAAHISTAGSYTVLPSNPVSQGSSSGSGLGAAFTMGFGVLALTVSAVGSYLTAPTLTFSGSGGAKATTSITDASFTGDMLLTTNGLGANDSGVIEIHYRTV